MPDSYGVYRSWLAGRSAQFMSGFVVADNFQVLRIPGSTYYTPDYEEISDDIKLLHYMIPIYMEDKVDGSHLRTLPDGSIQRKIERGSRMDS